MPGWTFPINIYYSKDESQTNRLLSKYGFIYLKGNSYYITGSPAIYIHKFDDNGQPVDNTSLLIKGITQHFITENLQGAPEWFIEGLSSFFAEQGDIINGKLIVSDPSPNTSLALMEKIDKGSRPNVKQLYGMTAEQLHGLPYGCHFARQLFYWLYDTNQLPAYLKNVKKDGFELTVLEKTTSKDFGKINLDLFEFLNKTCYSEAHFSQALGADDPAKKQECLNKTLELKKDYHKARLELVKHFHDVNDLEKCKDNLEQILSAPVSSEHMTSAVLLGNIYYIEKDYSRAVGYYTKAWDYSKNYDCRYRIAYRLANSYNHLRDSVSATKWYREFLAAKWNPEDMKLCADYAQKYLDYAKKVGTKKPVTRPNPYTTRRKPKS
ncbi:MAG: tetratricopeptide repeat protein [Planctomycetota bacterium]